jgi:hypothetical protein
VPCTNTSHNKFEAIYRFSSTTARVRSNRHSDVFLGPIQSYHIKKVDLVLRIIAWGRWLFGRTARVRRTSCISVEIETYHSCQASECCCACFCEQRCSRRRKNPSVPSFRVRSAVRPQLRLHHQLKEDTERSGTKNLHCVSAVSFLAAETVRDCLALKYEGTLRKWPAFRWQVTCQRCE